MTKCYIATYIDKHPGFDIPSRRYFLGPFDTRRQADEWLANGFAAPVTVDPKEVYNAPLGHHCDPSRRGVRRFDSGPGDPCDVIVGPVVSARAALAAGLSVKNAIRIPDGLTWYQVGWAVDDLEWDIASGTTCPLPAFA